MYFTIALCSWPCPSGRVLIRGLLAACNKTRRSTRLPPFRPLRPGSRRLLVTTSMAGHPPPPQQHLWLGFTASYISTSPLYSCRTIT
ncbi:hypothetical protein CEXT_9811 [Caerostris extrusa]|uniref:Secreted protein n=1 Tax=Caerostris extrusa TaxID=172846 RepID=A0AAV4YCX4_CAEEX|nr:hypothetical protein CEXT_9811 [Caerostris extrusa]